MKSKKTQVNEVQKQLDAFRAKGTVAKSDRKFSELEKIIIQSTFEKGK